MLLMSDLMNFTTKYRAFDHNTKLFIAKESSYATIEDFNVKAQYRRCATSLFLNLTSFATMCLIYTLYFLNYF